MDVSLHEADVSHTEALTRLYSENRAYLRKWEPERDPSFFEPETQHRLLAEVDRRRREGRQWTALIHNGHEYVGYMTLNHIVWGALRNCRIGYWVSQRHAGQGIATAAVARCLDIAFGELGLHRVEASVRTDNPASIRALENNGFRLIGLARAHVFLEGRWHDEWLYEHPEPGPFA